MSYARVPMRLAAGLVGATVLLVTAPAQAQPAQQTPQPEQAREAPPPWTQGRPPDLEGSTLRPHPPGLVAKPASEIRLDKVKLPAGFRIEVWAADVANARSMARGSKGTIFVGTRFVGNVYAIVDRGGRREVKVVAKGLHRPNGVAFKDGTLYVAELSRILRFDHIEDRLDNPPDPVVVFDKLPRDEPHGWKFLSLGPDGWLYFNVGAPCNICVPPYTHAQIVRVDPNARILQTYALGVRNSVGMDWHPRTRELWFTDNGRDWLGDNAPQDELNHAPRAGLHFGYPYCHQGDVLDPELGAGRACAEFMPPVLKLGPHTAGLGMRFYTGSMFPAQYRNRIVVALHGSWNRTKKTGFNVSTVSVDPRQPARAEVLADFLDGEEFLGRPADVLVMPDGALLVSDDVNGAVYRISYRR